MTVRTKKCAAIKLSLIHFHFNSHFPVITNQTVFSPLSSSAQSLRATFLLKNIVEGQAELNFFFSPNIETGEFVIPFQEMICIILENIFNDNTEQKPNAHFLVQQNQHKMDSFVGR